MKITVDLERLPSGRIKATAITDDGVDGVWSIRDTAADAMYAVAPTSLTDDAPKVEDHIGAGALSIGEQRPTTVERRVAVDRNAIVSLLTEAALSGADVKLTYTDGLGKQSERIVRPNNIVRKRPAGGTFPEQALLADDGEAVKTFYVENGVSGARIERVELV